MKKVWDIGILFISIGWHGYSFFYLTIKVLERGKHGSIIGWEYRITKPT